MKTIINYIKNNVKYLIIAIIILCIVICTPIVLSTIRKNKIENVVNEYINALKLGNYDESLTYLDEEYDYSNNAPLIYYNELIEFYSKFTVDIENIDIKNKYAIVKLKIKTPDIFYLLDQNFNLQFANKTYDINYYKSILNSRTLEYEEGKAQISLKKVDGEWKIINNEFLKIFLNYGSNVKEINFEYLVKSEKEKDEMMDYINKYMKINNFEIKSNNLGQISLHNIEIKNIGNKDIIELEVEIIFPSKKIKRTVVLFDDESSQLKSGNSWKSENDKYYDLNRSSKSILTNTDKENAQLKIRSLKFGNSIYGPLELEGQNPY